jgi:hypothetical protein
MAAMTAQDVAAVRAIYMSPHWIADPELDHATVIQLVREIGRLEGVVDRLQVEKHDLVERLLAVGSDLS